jgi:Undecaprenyl-phosphate glucose phosphotransferase
MSDEYSRVFTLVWFLVGGAALLLVHGSSAWLLARWRGQGKLATNVALVGSPESVRSLLTRFNQGSRTKVNVIATFECELGEFAVGGMTLTAGQLERMARRGAIDHVIIAFRPADHQRLSLMLRRLRTLPVGLEICPEALALADRTATYDLLFGLPVLSIARKPLAGSRRVLKRLEDIFISATLLVAFAPLMLVVAAAIRIDSRGPVLFRQKRFGFANEPVDVLKFRTMRSTDSDNGVQAVPNDPRVTRVGRFLRSTSLDELPQLYNVLRGDMSLVGPRPHPVSLNERFVEIIDNYLARHRVKPGITGWAQVNGFRGVTDTVEKMQRRVEHDLYYIENWSLGLDLWILARTAVSGFVHRNAY